MSFLIPKTIEEHILAGLRAGPKTTTSLLGEVSASLSVTKQGFYAALRKLKADETIVVYKGSVSINTAWIQRMNDRVREMQSAYLAGDDIGFLGLREGESISYRFANTQHLDTFWGHSQNVLISQTSVSEAVYSYDPHYWFYIARPDTEQKLVSDIVASGRQFLMTVGGASPLDKALKEDFSDDLRQYHLGNPLKNDNYYVVVIGNYVTEVTLDPEIAEQVNDIYTSATEKDTDSVGKLKNLLTAKARHKIKISRNSRKARELKATLGKNFFVRK